MYTRAFRLHWFNTKRPHSPLLTTEKTPTLCRVPGGVRAPPAAGCRGPRRTQGRRRTRSGADSAGTGAAGSPSPQSPSGMLAGTPTRVGTLHSERNTRRAAGGEEGVFPVRGDRRSGCDGQSWEGESCPLAGPGPRAVTSRVSSPADWGRTAVSRDARHRGPCDPRVGQPFAGRAGSWLRCLVVTSLGSREGRDAPFTQRPGALQGPWLPNSLFRHG